MRRIIAACRRPRVLMLAATALVASCASHASRLGSRIATWFTAMFMPTMFHSAGGGGKSGFSTSARS